MVGLGEAAGKLDEYETSILRNLLRLRSLTTRDIMTPRTVIVGFPGDATVAEALEAAPPFSRLPLYGTDLDDITGYVLKDDVLLRQAQGQGEVKLATLVRDIMTVPGALPLPSLLEAFLQQRQHIACVVSEYGGTDGLVTLEDVVETLLGTEIVDESDTVEDMRALARQQWAKRAKSLGLDVHTATDAPAEPDAPPEPGEPRD